MFQSRLLATLAVVLSVTPSALSAASSGCGKTHNTGLNQNLPFTQTNKQNRTYAVYVPTDYNSNTSFPRSVVFDFHGRNGSPEGQYNNSQYFKYSGGDAYLAVYPAGLPGKTSDNTCTGETAWQGPNYACPTANDTAFTDELLTHIENNYCVDTTKVYASGKSNGGGFTDTLACSSVGDRFAAFAMAAAALYTDNSKDSCTKHRAIMEAHGDADTTILPGGGAGAGGTTPNITTWTGWWGQRDGCTLSQRVVTQQDGYNTTTFSCGTGLTNVVTQFWVYGNGHCWPSLTDSTTDGVRPYCISHKLSYTEKVIAFFAKWNTGNAPKN